MTTEVYQIAIRPRAGYYRWVICALLFFAATINYIDRQVIGILKPNLVKEFQWQACNRGRRSYSNAIMKIPLAITIPTIGLLLIPGAGAQEIARPSNRPAASTNTAPSPRGARAPAPSPGSLPGKGLGQHPFLYAGQWDTRNPMETMFLVRDGKVVWTHTIPDTRT